MRTSDRHGFTLIELSIVLVIIGLIVGGILVGRDLIKAAEIRATVSQIEKYKTASLTFRNKYNGLPGDFPNAARFSFAATNQGTGIGFGTGDGNGVVYSSCVTAEGGGGESFLFWTHLAQSNLIADATTAITDYACHPVEILVDDTILPRAKVGRSNRFAVMGALQGPNVFIISAITYSVGTDGDYVASPALSPQDASSLDSKMDDSNPTTGIVVSIRAALPIIAGGAASPTAGDCYDSDATPTVYATATTTVAQAPGCELQVRAGF